MTHSQTTIPVEAYTSSRFFELEQKYLFSNTWAFAGLAEDLQNDGDFLTVQAGLNNLVVIKESHGHLSAFHNMCRHRGTQLVDGSGQLKSRITCPYHDWTYDLKGNLLSLPKAKTEFSALDKNCNSLKKANVGIWRGMIWVHPNPASESLESWFSSISAHLGPHEVEQLVEPEGSIITEDINANWKVVVENYIDHYHLAQLHAGTLNMYDHKRAVFGFKGNHFSFWEPLTKDYQSDIKRNSPYPLICDDDAHELGAWVPMLFPGIGLTESESTWSVFHVVPISANKTKIVIRTKMKDCSMMEYIKQGVISNQYWSNKVRAKNTQFNSEHALGSADFLKEDIFICEQVQRSMTSPYFEFGPTAEIGERPIRDHQELVWQIIKPHWES